MNEERANEVPTARRGWKKTFMVIPLLFFAAVAGLFWAVLPPTEPSYDGKTLSYWLAQYEGIGSAGADTKEPKAIESREAIRHIGTNALPTLLRMLRAKDSRVKLVLVNLIERQDAV